MECGVTPEMVKEVCGDVILDKNIDGSTSVGKPKSPGMKYKHYAPKAEVILIEEDSIDEIATKFGPDDYTTKMCAVMVGSSETTFYVLSVYFGSVGILKFRHAIVTGILADAMGIILAIAISRYFFL